MGADSVKFPTGMKPLAEAIEAKGMIPGIWIAPLLVTRGSAEFRRRPEWLLRDVYGRRVPAGYNPGWDGVFFCLDISLPEVEEYLDGVFDRLVEEWGTDTSSSTFFMPVSSRVPARGRRLFPGAARHSRITTD